MGYNTKSAAAKVIDLMVSTGKIEAVFHGHLNIRRDSMGLFSKRRSKAALRLVKGELVDLSDIFNPSFDAFKTFDDADKRKFLDLLSKNIYCNEGPVMSALCGMFCACARELHKTNPEEAYGAIRFAKAYAKHDRTSLKNRANETMGVYLKTYPDAMLDQIAESTFLYQMAVRAESELRSCEPSVSSSQTPSPGG